MQNIAFGILVFILIVLFAIVFFVLGKGEYKPGGAYVTPPPIVASAQASSTLA